MDREPKLTAAMVIHGVVCDMLNHHQLAEAELPEVVDLAVIITGIGALQSSFSFVKQSGSYWDSTRWNAVPRPFLDSHALAYANAVAAWVRDDKDPAWANELPNEIKRPMRKSLKYLFTSNDSFFQPTGGTTTGNTSLDRSQADWLTAAANDSTSTQVVAIRQLEPDEPLRGQQETLLVKALRSSVRAVVLHSISAVETLSLGSESVVVELQTLITNRDDETRAKAMMALARLGQLDESTIDKAAIMLDDRVKHVVYAGLYSVSSLESVSDYVLRASDRGLVRALQVCDYEFIGLFVSAMNRWLDDPQSHIERLLQDDQPDYLEIALEALQNIREPSAA